MSFGNSAEPLKVETSKNVKKALIKVNVFFLHLSLFPPTLHRLSGRMPNTYGRDMLLRDMKII